MGEYDPQTERYTLRAHPKVGAVQTAPTGNDFRVDLLLPCRVFGDMGGNFGTRNAFTPEFTLMPWAARRGTTSQMAADRGRVFSDGLPGSRYGFGGRTGA